MRTFTLRQDHYGYFDPTHHMVHPMVLVAWGRQHSFFPRLRELSVCGTLSVHPALDEQALSHFLRTPSLTSLQVNWAGKLYNLMQDSVDALFDACIGLESLAVYHVADEKDADYVDALQSWPRLLDKMIAGAAHLRVLDLWSNAPIQWETLVHLAATSKIAELNLCRVVGLPPNHSLHVGVPSSTLRSIELHEYTPHLRLAHTLLESCIAPHLKTLGITIFDNSNPEDEPGVSVQDLHSLLALVGRYTGLTSLRVKWCFDLLDPDTNICLSLPPLPQLTDLRIEGYFYPTLQVNVEQVQHVLALYPRLEHWGYGSIVTESEHAPVSLSELLDLLHPYPSIKELPVVIASADLPSEDTIAQFGTHGYGLYLDVQAGVSIVDLNDVVSRVFPYAKLNVLEIWVQSPL
jgi:hypothetical protein